MTVENGSLMLGARRFVVRGLGYRDPRAPCLYARDLPLMAAMGANTVRTYDLAPEADKTFASVLESTGLYWLADFPLDPYYDSTQTIAAQKERILAAFRKYAERFRGQARLIGYVFGGDVAREYEKKFAGSPADFYALTGAAAAVLREIEPGQPPLLAAAVSEPEELGREAGRWGGRYPAAWGEPERPRLAEIEDSVTPGALVRLPGRALLHRGPPFSDEGWPFHLAQTCLCVGGLPARLNFVASGEVSVQIPPGLEPGERSVVFFRAGAASNAVTIRVRQFSAASFAGPVLEARLH